jgi:hypothetical protein
MISPYRVAKVSYPPRSVQLAFVTLFFSLLLSASHAQELCETELEKAKCGIYPADFEVWQDGSGVRNKFPTHKLAEEHYEAAAFGNQICAGLLAGCQNVPPPPPKPIVPIPVDCNDLGWGGASNNQARWKPDSETTGQLVVLLPNNHCSNIFDAQGAFGQTFRPLISNMRIEDASGNVIDRGRLRHCGQHNNGRLHWNFGSVKNMPSPVSLKYDFEGKERCRQVSNPRSDLGR